MCFGVQFLFFSVVLELIPKHLYTSITNSNIGEHERTPNIYPKKKTEMIKNGIRRRNPHTTTRCNRI